MILHTELHTIAWLPHWTLREKVR